ncbi:MAG: glutamate--cysteine ligase [Candidatus Competibacteraceae bacterium]
MYRDLDQRLTRLFNADPHTLLDGRLLGLEREALRMGPEGYIAQTPHPVALGSALTHPYITTDYSEALLEFITPPLSRPGEALRFLGEIHQFVQPSIGDERLWAASMPCILAGESSIAIAEYGRSNLGLMKHVYRRGLAWRYGRIMQVIAGIHVNFSLPDEFWTVFQDREGDRRTLQDFRSEAYFALIRNLQRFGWLILYLFGASPAVCKSFLDGKSTPLSAFDDHTCYGPYATSLRMSNVGYTNRTEKKSGVNVCYNSLPEYLASLTQATATPWPPYERIGVVVDGEYRQLNANILQIENEYYSSMRPKQPPQGNEKPTVGLRRRGVGYVELRSVDINPLEPLGVTLAQLRFLETFLLFCLLNESPPLDDEERRMIDDNQMATALSGRDPALVLQRRRHPALPLRRWAQDIFSELQPLGELLDLGENGRPYTMALAEQREVLADPDRTPAARILAEMRASGENFFQYARRLSEQHRQYFQSLSLAEDRVRFFTETVERSLREQAEIEAADQISFEEFLRRYFEQD